MNAKDLIDQLSKAPPETIVYLWIDGDRLPITLVDLEFLEDGFLDINAEV